MSKNIEKVGGQDRAAEIVKFYRLYFKAYKFYNCDRGIFCKEKTDESSYVYMPHLIGDLKGITK